MIRLLIWTAALALHVASWDGGAHAEPAGAAGSGLTAVPMGQAIQVTVMPPVDSTGPLSLYRWADGEAPARLTEFPADRMFLDASAAPNRFYSYQVRGGTWQSPPVHAIISDLGRPFVCPALPRVPDDRLGVDRTERFTGPSGKEVTFTIKAPVVKPFTVDVPPCNGAPGCSDHANIANAIATLKKQGGGTLQLEAGTYRLSPPLAGRPYAHIEITYAHDIIFRGRPLADGTPATHVLFEAFSSDGTVIGFVHGFYVGVSERILAKDVAFDWGRDLAMPGRLVDAGNNTQHLEIDDGAYYIPNPADPPDISVVNSFDAAKRVFLFRAWGRFGLGYRSAVFNPQFAQDGRYFYVINGRPMPSGSTVLATIRSGHAVHVAGKSSDVSFERVYIYGGGASGFVFGPGVRAARISNSAIIRKPDHFLKPGEKSRFISIRGDSNARNTDGEFLIESTEFGMIDDDAFNITGELITGRAGTRVESTSQVVFVYQGYNPFPRRWSAGETVTILDPVTLKPMLIPAATPATRTSSFDAASNTYTVTFDLAVPQPHLAHLVGKPLDPAPYFGFPRESSARFVVRDSCFHDLAGGRLVVQTADGLIENNVFANTGGPAIDLTANPVSWSEGPGASNIIVRGNRLAGAGYGYDDWNATGGVTGRITGWLGGSALSMSSFSVTGFHAKGGPHSHIEISDNFISNTRGAGMLVSGVAGVVVKNNVVMDANAIPFIAGYQEKYCGSKAQGFQKNGVNQPWCLAKTAGRGGIIITHSEQIAASGNRMLGTSQDIFIDPNSTD